MNWLRPASFRLVFFFVLLLLVAFVGWVVPSAAAQTVQLVRGPYLQDVTTTSALVCWGANAPHTGSVAYGTAPALTSEAPAPDSAADHCVRLSNLAPFSRYSYQVKVGASNPSPTYTFRTMAGPDQGPVQFIAWGDNRDGDDVHASLVSRIVPFAPGFVLNVGDMVGEGRQMAVWNTFFRIEQPLLAISPLYPVLGNHEDNSPLYFSLFSLPGNERWYSFDTGPLHVIALDVYFSQYLPGSEQYTWLEQDLRETARPWKVLLLHSPPYSYSPSRGSGEEPVRAALAPLIERYGVQLVISGHNHFYQRNIINGVTYMTAGAGGAPLHEVSTGPGTAYTESVPHFVRFTASATELSSVGIRQDGSEFDPFTLRLSSPGAPPPATPVGGVVLPPPTPPSLIDQFTCRRCHLSFPLTSWASAREGVEQHGSLLAVVLGLIVVLVVATWLVLRAFRLRRKGPQTHAAESQSHP